jgi:hypothetical protein
LGFWTFLKKKKTPFPAGESGSAAGSLLSSHRPNCTWARSALAGKGAEARFALLCQCPLPTSSLRVLRSSLYCRLSSDLHSFRFVRSRVLGFPNLTVTSFLSKEALPPG